MLQAIIGLLKDFETLIYKILMWVILVPKTLVMIILDPRQAAKYIQSELNDGKSHFDEYVSPVILLLMVALLPSLGYNVLPEFGAKITSPAEIEPTLDRIILFETQVDFISSAPELEYFIDWEVWRKTTEGKYEIETIESHPGDDGGDEPEKVDTNTVKDKFLYAFSPGEYLVYVYAINVKSDNDQYYLLEDYESYITVIAPVDSTAHMRVFNEGTASIEQKEAAGGKKFLDQVKEEQTIYLALALMIPPLLFAFVTRMFKYRRMDEIGSESLLESFYVQCYYFSPLGLAIWGTYYAYYFFTEDAYFYWPFNTSLQILLLPLVWAALWFIRTEVKRIIWELQRDENRKPDEEKDKEIHQAKVLSSKAAKIASIVIVIVCFGIIGYGVNIIVNFEVYMDDLRLTAIRLFPSLTLLLILGFAVSWFMRRKDKEEKLDGRKFWMNGAGLGALTLLFVGVMNLISDQTTLASPVPEIADSQATSIAVVDVEMTSTPEVLSSAPLLTVTPTLQPLESSPATAAATVTLAPSPYYTEEFNTSPASFFDFMTYGDPRMVKEVVDLGTLSIGLNPLEDKFAWYYLINNTHTYSRVRVEAVVTNQGNNANGISLICNYSSVGWYEIVFSSSGIYKVYVVDNQGIVNQGYNEIANGGSEHVKIGLSTNVYAIECDENKLALYINNVEELRITDTIFKLTEGKIGLAVSSPQKLPVNVGFESLTVSEP